MMHGQTVKERRIRMEINTLFAQMLATKRIETLRQLIAKTKIAYNELFIVQLEQMNNKKTKSVYKMIEDVRDKNEKYAMQTMRRRDD